MRVNYGRPHIAELPRIGRTILQRSTEGATLKSVGWQSDATLMFVSSTSSIGGFSPKPHGFGLFSAGKTL
jgi:hypothetical protein